MFAPFILDRDVYALADNLEHGAAPRFVGAVDHALAAIDARRQLARSVTQGFQRKRAGDLAAPAGKSVAMIMVVAAVQVMAGMGIVMMVVAVQLRGVKRPAESRMSNGTSPRTASTRR